MAAPATTGVLRTKVSDMQIGDYLKCYMECTAGVAPTFYGDHFGVSVAYPEIAYTGMTGASGSQSGTFYFIKVDKGLLIADRVCQVSISWDTLNTAKFIQGKPFDTLTAIPAMTSNTAPSGTASASSFFGGQDQYNAWAAFNRVSDAEGWCTVNGSPTGWLAYDFGSAKIIGKYSVKSGTGGSATYLPKDWTFEGSNDGSTWAILDTQKNQTAWGFSEKKSFMLSNPKSYIKYRINITANNGGTYVKLDELEMMETAGILRSPTGGVAYADANGSPVSVAPTPNTGGWPTNNDWSKYVLNFPTDKILSGKTLDDVWHPYPYTWSQDTPILAINPSTYRVQNSSLPSANFHSGSLSNSVSANIGFRPVFNFFE